MKLYTRQGDAGQTQLFGGQRVRKDDLRVEAYGTVDELNALLGVCLAACTDDEVRDILTRLQHRLFEVGSDLATPPRPDDDDKRDTPSPRTVPVITAEQIAQAEGWIDTVCARLPPMRYFILPGGTELSARLHQARTVCRRAERRVVTLAQHEPVNAEVVIYLNRLSDLLFALSRYANHLAGVEDTPWLPRPSAR
jgi:cob(I)alamin adenosyltransferase